MSRILVKYSFTAPLLALVLFCLLFMWGRQTAVLAQDLPTATPDASGAIYYDVGIGDTWWTIAARHKIPLNELLSLNGAEEGDFVQLGQRLLVGSGLPPSPTPLPTPDETPTPRPSPTPLPSPTPQVGTLCLVAFVDTNQDGVWTADELLRAAVAFTIAGPNDTVTHYITDGFSEPHCFETLPVGNYLVTRSFRANELPTTDNLWDTVLTMNNVVQLEFGSILPSEMPPTPTSTVPPQATFAPGLAPITSVVTASLTGEGGVSLAGDTAGERAGGTPWILIFVGAAAFLLVCGGIVGVLVALRR